MSDQRMYFDSLEELDAEVNTRTQAVTMKKRPYSPRFVSRKPKCPLSKNGAHRRRQRHH